MFRDEYKEFEKLIQADLQEVDNRMEEEEVRSFCFCMHARMNELSLNS